MIEVKDLKKNYGNFEAVKGVSFKVFDNEIYGLLGPNGAGKTTIISILCGLIEPSSGTVYINNLNLFQESLSVKKIIGVVPQEAAFYKELSASENLMFFGSLYGLKGNQLKQSVYQALELVGLTHRMKEPVEKFSGGMLRRLNFACGILHKPKVLLLDEPTVGIDPQTRLNILEMITNTASQGTTILFTTHYLYEAEQICHRIGIIDDGKLLIEGTLDELKNIITQNDIIIIKGDFTKDLIQNKLSESKIMNAKIISCENGTATISIPSKEQNITTLLKTFSKITQIKEFNIKQPSLETLFIQLTGKELREN